MSNRVPRGEDPRGQFPLELKRIEAGEQLIVRVLTRVEKRVMGCNTHYNGKRSEYCGPACKSAFHFKSNQWKGYLACERWFHELQIWIPCVVEVTEASELDMRGQVQRGQVWLLAREVNHKGKQAAVRASLMEQVDAHQLPVAFSMHAVLHWIFHRDDVVLNIPNPMPDRITVAGTPGQVPQCMAPDPADKPLSAEEIRERIAAARRKGDLPPIEPNGRIANRNVR